jgi:BON domain-containing protein
LRFATLGALMAAVIVFGVGCRTLTGRSVGQWADDHTISTNVKAALAALRGGGGARARINVDTYEGTVYLSGIVDSESARRRAEALARSVDNVEQVVTNLQVREGLASASPDPTERRHQARMSTRWHPLLSRITGLRRIEGTVATPEGPFSAYDRSGRLVATIYTISMRDLAQRGVGDLEATGRPIDHVAIYSMPALPDVPDPQYHVVLWHVTRGEEATLW